MRICSWEVTRSAPRAILAQSIHCHFHFVRIRFRLCIHALKSHINRNVRFVRDLRNLLVLPLLVAQMVNFAVN